jgi:hypothetical protein
MSSELLFSGVSDIVPDRLGKEPVRYSEILFAVTEKYTSSVVKCGSGRLRHQSGLAYAGLA